MILDKLGHDKSDVFIIAEIGNNHNGSFDRAIQMIDECIELKVDCVKFQMRNLEEVYRQASLKKSGDDLGTEYVLDLLRKFELSIEEQKKLNDYCKVKGIIYLCTPWDSKSIQVLEGFGVPAYKVASADLTNLPLLERLSETEKPLILSTGMSTEEEVKITTSFLIDKKVNFTLLHCNSTYPAPYHDINLNWIKRLKDIHPNFGYSGHERGIAVTLGAVALGAKVIERHYTLDRNMEGPDHAASLEFSDFKLLVKGIRQLEESLGQDSKRQLSQGEMINRENLSKSLVASRPIKKGETITSEHIKVLSPGLGLSPQKYNALIGVAAKKDFLTEDFFFPSDLSDLVNAPRGYSFSRPWGVPVRYHDFNRYNKLIAPDIYEFHLSYSDMELDPSDYLEGEYNSGLVVHAPELFSGSHLMDLTSQDQAYRERSINETQRVIDVTKALKKFFPSSKKPMIVANIGGFSMDSVIEKENKLIYYQEFEESLGKLDLDGVELIPQTMAPFPWHFGGQRYQNLFVEIEEIIEWCSKLGLRMCFDVSHTSLACNHMNKDFYDFARKIAPFTAHLHLGDASGVNGEGLQVGDGELDFKALGNILKEGCPEASFIPEIWQGHKDGGSGFWTALEKLEKYI
jgi:N-acetylneuraminate synthase